MHNSLGILLFDNSIEVQLQGDGFADYRLFPVLNQSITLGKSLPARERGLKLWLWGLLHRLARRSPRGSVD